MTDEEILDIARYWSNSSYVQHDGRFILEFGRALIGAQQAKIDSLMFEYCPEEMTEEQIAEWGKHQVRA